MKTPVVAGVECPYCNIGEMKLDPDFTGGGTYTCYTCDVCGHMTVNYDKDGLLGYDDA